MHTAVSGMLIGGTPIAKVARIAGWSASTMVLRAKPLAAICAKATIEMVEHS